MTVQMLRAAGAGVDDCDAATSGWSSRAGCTGRGWDIEPDLSGAVAVLRRRAGHRRRGDPARLAAQQRAAGRPAARAAAARWAARSRLGTGGLTVRGTGTMHGLDADLSDVGELTPVLAALAALADSPSRAARRRAHPRPRDRPARRAGPRARPRSAPTVTETADGLEIQPAPAARRRLRDLRRPPDGARRRGHRAGRARASSSTDVACTSKTLPEFPALWSAMVTSADVRGAGRWRFKQAGVRRGRRPGPPGRGPRVRAPAPGRSTTTRSTGFVIAVDRGRYTCVAGRRRTEVTAMRARELGRKSVVVGDRVGAGRRHLRRRPARWPASSGSPSARSVLRRTADDDDTTAEGRHRTGGGGQRRPAGDRQRAGRPAAAHRVHRPLPGRRVRRRHRAAAVPHQGRPGRPGGGAGLLRRARPAARAGPPGLRPRPSCASALAGRVSVLVGHSGRRQVDAGQPARAGRRPGGRRGQRDRQGPAHLDQRGRAAAAPGPQEGRPGWIIDTPGVRSFGLAHVSADSLLHGFPDLVEGDRRLPAELRAHRRRRRLRAGRLGRRGQGRPAPARLVPPAAGLPRRRG